MDGQTIDSDLTVFFTIRHPARVHLYRNTIDKLSSDGASVHTVVVGSKIIIDLLDTYGIDYECIASTHDSIPGLIIEQSKIESKILSRSIKTEPDLMIDGIAAQHVSKVVGATSVSFMDTEHATFTKKITVPFTDKIYTPDCYQQDFGEKQIRYPGYHELAYLHPNRFDPDPTVLDEVGLVAGDPFVILRLVGWDAVHDLGDSGFEDIEDVVTALEEMGAKVLITAEDTVPESVEHCQLSIEPHRIHDLMYYADLFIGESATMASESAALGTPAVFVSSSRRGYTDELEEEYGLVFNYSGPNRQRNGLKKALSILESYDEQLWEDRRKKMLEDKIDTTEFILEQITGTDS